MHHKKLNTHTRNQRGRNHENSPIERMVPVPGVRSRVNVQHILGESGIKHDLNATPHCWIAVDTQELQRAGDRGGQQSVHRLNLNARDSLGHEVIVHVGCHLRYQSEGEKNKKKGSKWPMKIGDQHASVTLCIYNHRDSSGRLEAPRQSRDRFNTLHLFWRWRLFPYKKCI